MGHHHDKPEQPSGFDNPNVQAHVPASIPRQDATVELPDDASLIAARAMMATPKLAVIGGHTGLLILTDYDVSDNSYHGEFHRNRSMDVADKLPAVTSIHGLRPYTEDARNELVFVECNSDTSVLRNLQRRLQARPAPPVEVNE